MEGRAFYAWGGEKKALPRRRCSTGSFRISEVPQEEGTGRGREGEEISGSDCNKSKLRRVRDTQLGRYPGLVSGLGGPGKWRDEMGSGPRVETKREGNGRVPSLRQILMGFHLLGFQCMPIFGNAPKSAGVGGDEDIEGLVSRELEGR